jgi:D-arabinose 1-dehydrogenase-like Zn-dependent alcohol dehydrogenase
MPDATVEELVGPFTHRSGRTTNAKSRRLRNAAGEPTWFCRRERTVRRRRSEEDGPKGAWVQRARGDYAMAKMRVVQVARPKAPLEVVERDVPEAGPGTVRIKVDACGVCHSDVVVVEGLFPGIEYPRVPGHEVVGVVDAIGAGVAGFVKGQRVGVGWNGGYDGTCDACRRGDFFACRNTRVTGLSSDGGYAEYMIARTEAVARFPEGLAVVDSAPLLCAGVTTFNALRNSGARPGDLVAILGVGGLGHLAVQYASKMGFFTVAIDRGQEREQLARKLGAAEFIDSRAQDPASELTKLGGARVVLATAPSASAMSALIGGLAPRGKLLAVGVPVEPLSLPVAPMVTGALSVEGWYSGMSIDSQDTLVFGQRADVRSMNEYFPLERAADAYAHMVSGKVRFRAVLTMAPR